MTRLSPNFSLAEMIQSQTAARRGLDNTPAPEIMERLKNTAMRMEAVRSLLGKPILVSSGYRAPAVNKAVGGVPTSHHVMGWAVDFIAPGYGSPLEICRAIAASKIEFDQVIMEGSWVHISFAPAMRRQVLTKTAKGFQTGLAA